LKLSDVFISKAAGTRARKTSLEIEKTLKQFRKLSIEAAQ
jgi:hypothetical protein